MALKDDGRDDQSANCIRCGAVSPGSFSGECAKCEAVVLREWLATENCKSEIRALQPPMTHEQCRSSGVPPADDSLQKDSNSSPPVPALQTTDLGDNQR